MVQMETYLARRHHAHAHSHAGGLQHSTTRVGLYQQPESALAWQLEAGVTMVRQAQGWPLLLRSQPPLQHSQRAEGSLMVQHCGQPSALPSTGCLHLT